jgi:hypothetical protein
LVWRGVSFACSRHRVSIGSFLELLDFGSTILKLKEEERSQSASTARSASKLATHPYLNFSRSHVELLGELLASGDIGFWVLLEMVFENLQLRW